MSMTLRHLWYGILRASLTRRLVLAQVGFLLLLWLILIGFFVYDIAYIDDWFEPRELEERADMILSVMDGLNDAPEKLQEALLKIDEFQRDENRERDDPGVRVTMNAWFGDTLVYATPGEPGVIEVAQLDSLETSVQHGRRLRTFAHESASSNARVVLIFPGDAAQAFFALGRRGIVLLPLIICMPLLILPAWFSVRLALRPFHELSEDVATKNARNLQPLVFNADYSELNPIVTSVNELLTRLRTGIAAERRFIADAAHELRTPLAAIRVNVEALKERSQDERDRTLLNSIVNSSERSSRLVGQLLALMRSDSDSSHFDMELLHFDELLQEQLAELSSIARSQGVDLELDLPDEGIFIHAEREGLRSLVDNIIENAIKYSPPKGTVSVSLTNVANSIELRVTDSGPGISEEYRDQVFERFFRVPDQVQEGSGLGLAIVKRVSERLGAEVFLEEPENGRGLRVRVLFPTKSV